MFHLVSEVRAVAEITIFEVERGAACKLFRITEWRSESTRPSARECARDGFHQWSSQHLRYRIECGRDLHRHLSRVTRKHFVAAHAREHHGQRLARGARD